MIPYGRQDINQEDIEAVQEVLTSDFLTQGPVVSRFERACAEYCGARYAVAANSGTSSLHLACRALGVGPGDRVWTSPITFVASANCALYCGASVDFVDIDEQTGNIDPRKLGRKLARAHAKGTLPKVVIPVHFGGQPCDMEAIWQLSDTYGFQVIEDACHALGASFQNVPVGNCGQSAITIFSFHPVKIITSGEGGLATTNDPYLAEKMRLLRSHGVTRDADMMTSAPDGPWYYEQIDLGFNYRMTDIHAALGLSQLKRLDAFVGKRRQLADNYDRLLAGLPVTPLARRPDRLSAFHLYVILLQLNQIRLTHAEVLNQMRAAAIGVNLHYIPVYRQPYFQKLGFSEGYCPQAEHYYQRALTLPLYPALTPEEQEKIVHTLSRITSL